MITILTILVMFLGQPVVVSKVVPTDACAVTAEELIPDIIETPGVTSLNWQCVNVEIPGRPA